MDIMYQIVNNIEQRDYIRMYPLWYKELNRNSERYQEFVNEIETIKKQSQPTRLQKFEKQLNFAQFMLKMINNK
ncbi:MAG: YlbE-like family protein [Turicibacter sp.]